MDQLEYTHLSVRRTMSMRAALHDLHVELERLSYGTAAGKADPAHLAELHERIRKCDDLSLHALSADQHAARELNESALGPPYAPWRGGNEAPVGLGEIAEMLGVRRATVDQWRQRKVMPVPPWTVSGRPLWVRYVIEDWARDTGRLKLPG